MTVQLSCSDPSGRALTLAIVTGPAHGTLGAIDQAAQTVQFTPAAGYSGADSLTYNATAGGQSSNTATVTITVNAVPKCAAVNASVSKNTPGPIQLSCSGGTGALPAGTAGAQALELLLGFLLGLLGLGAAHRVRRLRRST